MLFWSFTEYQRQLFYCISFYTNPLIDVSEPMSAIDVLKEIGGKKSDENYISNFFVPFLIRNKLTIIYRMLDYLFYPSTEKNK